MKLKTMNKRFLFGTMMVACAVGVQAKVKLPHILGDNMILQQNTEARLWGTAKKGSAVSVTVSWSDAVYQAKVGKDGKFLVRVKTPAASYTPLQITFDDGDGKVMLKNVLAGEVWVCAGQSNMEMPIEGFGNCPVEGYNDVVLDAKNRSGIHFVKIPSIMSTKPLDDADCHWDVTTMETVKNASATGYFFARMVNQTLDIPVGLVMANKGGSRVESWLTEENLKRYTDENLDSVAMTKNFKWDFHYPLLWGNGTFNPILNYTVGGIIFYQGCSNVGDPGNKYSDNLKLLVEQWRSQFDCGEIPFYFVEIAPYWNDDVNGDWGSKLREQQVRASHIIPNSALVCTNDLVYPWETKQIHPAMKRQVGERLALHALVKTYGQKGFMCDSPEMKECRFEGEECIVSVRNDYDAIAPFTDVIGFELAGDDSVFHPAVAEHDWQRGGYVVSSPEVKKPVAVRYCFRNFQQGNIHNRGGLPMFPFRSDDW